GGERAGGRRIERGAQRGELLERRIAAYVVVALQIVELLHPVGEEAREPCRGCVLVARERELVLLLAPDLPLLRHLLAVLAHRKPGARLGDPGMDRREVPRPQLADGAQLGGPALAAREREHAPLQVAAVGKRHIARAVRAAGEGAVDLAAVDAVRELR